jgi:hypothetical protein
MVRPIGRFFPIRPDAVQGISFGFVHEERMGKTRDNGHDLLTTKGFLTYHQKGGVIESSGVLVFSMDALPNDLKGVSTHIF